jgi:glucose-6-phosphate 1-dehydrogenase
VPFYVRAGKCMATTATEVVVEFHSPPRLLFAHPDSRSPHPNHLRFCLGPTDAVTLTMEVKALGDELLSRPADFSADIEGAGIGKAADAYERLLDDAIEGDARRFARVDSVEEAWRVVQPVLDNPPPVIPYECGSWGPPEADQLIGGNGWHHPISAPSDRPA